MDQAEIARLLQALVQQQAALLQAHADGLRLQRLVLEQLLGQPANGADAPPTPSDSTPGPPGLERPDPAPAAAAESATPPRPEPAMEPAEQAPEVVGPAPPIETLPPDTPPPVRDGPSTRAARYFQAHPVRPAQVVTRQELAVLRGVADVGEAGRLILQFGPHRGATLGQVAQTNPAYVRELALKAQRPEVRAAALQLLGALEASGQVRSAPGRGRRSASGR